MKNIQQNTSQAIQNNQFAIDAWGLKIKTEGMVSIVAAALIGYALIKYVSSGKSIEHFKKIKDAIRRKKN